jgi:hypothetical protein
MVKEKKERRYNLKERMLKKVVPKFFPWEPIGFYELTT